ncbi:FGGY-family carbohydrate kinase [Antarcticirhabdus aurantiaca]|uniref:FGGY-family carbohydrate kinase n=1 Tax=Antarcticirhabdus aurantiaca TaxID=2606717 RepID=A0ACD4NLH3_9HYPH|nr:FGGY-family carbohydrate kinase [Antarcticirhabdus aurantiaca]WAJ27674.1 FGGY-family carbohydrate kinase [Jeongeuplla avenae]
MTPSAPRHVAVIDVGKTNAKLVVHDLETGRDVFEARRANAVLAGPPYPHFDADGLFDFLLDSLAEAATRHPVDAISVTTHGACAALVAEDGLALPILDYESDAPEETRASYDAARPPFAETFSPRLPNGLNVGAQLFWLQHRFPAEFARASHVLTYPQYWAWRLTGRAASEATSLGCHTDLWEPAANAPSSLVARQGWADTLPPLASAFEALGVLKGDLAARIGLAGRAIPVHCGIHDSNASLLPHLLAREAPFSVLSTGTWVIAFAAGGALGRLDPGRDMLANVDAFGRAVPSARFMGGREFDQLTGGTAPAPSEADTEAVIAEGVMALPSFAPGTGPYPDRRGAWTHDPAELSHGERTAAATLYVALMAAEVLDAAGAAGPSVVEGPFAANVLFLRALATLTGRPVEAAQGSTGTSAGAALLALPPQARGRHGHATQAVAPDPAFAERLRPYREAWRAAL